MTETLPTTATSPRRGRRALKEAQPYAQNMIDAFKPSDRDGTADHARQGAARPRTTTTTTTTLPHARSAVDVLNASTVNGIAHTTATALHGQGFT